MGCASLEDLCLNSDIYYLCGFGRITIPSTFIVKWVE